MRKGSVRKRRLILRGSECRGFQAVRNCLNVYEKLQTNEEQAQRSS